MSGKFQLVNPININNWNELILDYSFFHTREWAEVLNKTYGFEPIYFCLYENNQISSVIPTMLINSLVTGRRLVSLPFSDFCEPLIVNQSDDEELLSEIQKYALTKKIDYLEFRSISKRYPYETQNFRTDLRHVLKLDKSESELFRSFSDNTKRNIKKANKLKVKLEIRNDISGIKIFYDMMCETRKKHGLPPQPFLFFLNILNIVTKPGYGDILLAAKDDEYIAGAIYLKTGKKLLYKYGASYSKYYDLRGNNFVMWEAIKKYLSEGYTEFDFGRTEIENSGLRRFKLGWNSNELNIYTTRFSIKNKSFLSSSTKTSGIHNFFFQHSPVFISKIIGRVLYKHIG